MAIHAHLIGKSYGMRPTAVLDSAAWRFWMDAEIRAAGVAWEAEQQERRQQDGAGTATAAEQEELADAQDERAAQREQGQPDVREQLAALQDGSGGDA